MLTTARSRFFTLFVFTLSFSVAVTALAELRQLHTLFKAIGTGWTGLEKMRVLFCEKILGGKLIRYPTTDTQVFFIGMFCPSHLIVRLTAVTEAFTTDTTSGYVAVFTRFHYVYPWDSVFS
jgi:hypothetical protein